MFVAVNLIILNEKNEIYLAKRNINEDVEPGKWGVPGGSVEQNESLEGALHREIKEETNCDITEFHYFKSYVVNSVLAVYFYGKIKGQIKLNEESSEYKWFNIKEINKLDLAFNQGEILKDFLKHIN